MAKFFLVLGILAMVLTGGCSLLFAVVGMGPGAIVIGAIPFLIALWIFIAAKNKIDEKTRSTGSFTLDRVKSRNRKQR